MPIRLAAVAVCLAVLPFAASRAEAQTQSPENTVVELGVMFWSPTPELTLSTDGLSGVGIDEVDFVQEFGIEDKRFPELRATIGRRHKFRVSYVSIQYDEETTLQRTIVFQGRTFAVNAPASTDIKWDLWRLGYEWDFVSGDRGFLGIVADLKYNQVEASIDSPALTEAAATDTTAPVPTFGVIGRGYVADLVSITGEFTGLSLTRDEFDVSFFDFDIYGTVSFGRHVGIQGGYRSVVADYVLDEDTGDLKLKGTYFGVVVRF